MRRLSVGAALVAFAVAVGWVWWSGGSGFDHSGGVGLAETESSPLPAPMSLLSAVFVTVPSQSVGKAIASSLVQSRLAACVNIIPGLTSIYEWQGKVEEDQELLLMIKTRKGWHVRSPLSHTRTHSLSALSPPLQRTLAL